ncbi:hypothetical protein E1B28_010547 [Marasmius oreades]|uniref:Uncharacterized protein n=1 Tax=Marasmius oreades TaxID=181124 RepID=A0A9P7URL6_9AGAR|nr:uncharacterized protein E1B28_010547 [Marasmius oreades]KAG7091518.1 hypothetical protein E1B28_010547 [Marasmius oreades]
MEGRCLSFQVRRYAGEYGFVIEGISLNPIKGGGFAAMYGPDGKQREERILTADIDLDDPLVAKLSVDPVGHCFRPDFISHPSCKSESAGEREREKE